MSKLSYRGIVYFLVSFLSGFLFLVGMPVVFASGPTPSPTPVSYPPRNLTISKMTYDLSRKVAFAIVPNTFYLGREQNPRLPLEVSYQWEGEPAIIKNDDLFLAEPRYLPQVAIEIPGRTTPGNLKVTVIVDPNNKIVETSDTDNTFIFTTPKVDLALKSVKEIPGGKYTAEFQNVGETTFMANAANPITLYYRYGWYEGSVQKNGETYATHVNLPANTYFAIGTTGTITTVELPPPQTTFATFWIHSALPQNVSPDTNDIAVLTLDKTDLGITDVQSTYFDNRNTLTVTIKNLGVKRVLNAPIKLKVDMGTNPATIDERTDTIAAFEPGQEKKYTFTIVEAHAKTITISLDPDHVIPDFDSRNNTQLYDVPDPDLTIYDVHPFPYQGMYVPITVTVRNIGGGVVPLYGSYFTQNQATVVLQYTFKDSRGHQVAQQRLTQDGVNGGTNTPQNWSFTIPTVGGSVPYGGSLELKVDPDNYLREERDDNNSWSSPNPPRPDMAITSLDIHKVPAGYYQGQVGLQNVGDGIAHLAFTSTNPYNNQYVGMYASMTLTYQDGSGHDVGPEDSIPMAGVNGSSEILVPLATHTSALSFTPPDGATQLTVELNRPSSPILVDSNRNNDKKTIPLLDITPTVTPTASPTPTLTLTQPIQTEASTGGTHDEASPAGYFDTPKDDNPDTVAIDKPNLRGLPCSPKAFFTGIKRGIQNAFAKNDTEKIRQQAEYASEDIQELEELLTKTKDPCIPRIEDDYSRRLTDIEELKRRIADPTGPVAHVLEEVTAKTLANQTRLGKISDRIDLNSKGSVINLRDQTLEILNQDFAKLSSEQVTRVLESNLSKTDSLDENLTALETIQVLKNTTPATLTPLLDELKKSKETRIRKALVTETPTTLTKTLENFHGDSATIATIMDSLSHDAGLPEAVKTVLSENKFKRTKTIAETLAAVNLNNVFRFTDTPTVENLRLFTDISSSIEKDKKIPDTIKQQVGKAQKGISTKFYDGLTNVSAENQKKYMAGFNTTYTDTTQLKLYKTLKQSVPEKVDVDVAVFENDLTSEVKTIATSKKNKTEQQQFLSSFFGFTDEDYASMQQYTTFFPPDYLDMLEQYAKELEKMQPYVQELQNGAASDNPSKEEIQEEPVEEIQEETIEEQEPQPEETIQPEQNQSESEILEPTDIPEEKQ